MHEECHTSNDDHTTNLCNRFIKIRYFQPYTVCRQIFGNVYHTDKKRQQRHIDKIKHDIRRKSLCIFLQKRPMALEYIIPHRRNGNIDINQIHQQQRNLFFPVRQI